LKKDTTIKYEFVNAGIVKSVYVKLKGVAAVVSAFIAHILKN
jgi:hypothetical protein